MQARSVIMHITHSETAMYTGVLLVSLCVCLVLFESVVAFICGG